MERAGKISEEDPKKIEVHIHMFQGDNKLRIPEEVSEKRYLPRCGHYKDEPIEAKFN